MAIYRGTGGWSNTTGTAEADAVVAAQVAVQNALTQIETDLTASESYKNKAEAAAITATNSATGIEGHANLAATKAVEASNSATNSANSATASATSATNSASSAALASDWAQKTTGEVVTGQGYSAKYWANAAANAVSDGVIVDTATSTLTTWSSSKIDTGKQNTLVSGTNIKTINGESVLGSGNISTVTSTGTETLTNKTLAEGTNFTSDALAKLHATAISF